MRATDGLYIVPWRGYGCSNSACTDFLRENHDFYEQQLPNGRCTVIIPNNRNIATGQRNLFPNVVRNVFRDTGYQLYDTTYASRRTQQKQGRQMAVFNNHARRARVPMTDISEVLTFIKSSPQ